MRLFSFQEYLLTVSHFREMTISLSQVGFESVQPDEFFSVYKVYLSLFFYPRPKFSLGFIFSMFVQVDLSSPCHSSASIGSYLRDAKPRVDKTTLKSELSAELLIQFGIYKLSALKLVY